MRSRPQAQGSQVAAASEELSRRAADELNDLARRAQQLEAQLRAKEKEVAAATRALDASKAAMGRAQVRQLAAPDQPTRCGRDHGIPARC